MYWRRSKESRCYRLLQGTLRALGPNHALVLFCDRTNALVYKLLHSLATVGLGSEDIALRIGSNAVDRVELARLPSAVAEAGQHFERLAVQYVDLLVGSVSQEDVFLLRILRKRDIPNGTVAAGLFVQDLLFDVSPILFEDLNAIVGTVADIEEIVDREFGAVDRVAELFGRRLIRIVRAKIGVVRLCAIGA